MPPSAKISIVLESHGRISTDSREPARMTCRLLNSGVISKAQRMAKEVEALKVGRRIQGKIRARCCKCRRLTDFLYDTCSEVGCGHLKFSICL